MDQILFQKIVDFIQISIASGVTGSVAYDLIKASFSGIKKLFLSNKNDPAKIRELIEAELNKNPQLLKECEEAYHISIKNGDYVKGDKYVIQGDYIEGDKIDVAGNYIKEQHVHKTPSEKKKKKN